MHQKYKFIQREKIKAETVQAAILIQCLVTGEQTALEEYVRQLTLVDQSALLVAANQTLSLFSVTVDGQVIQPDVTSVTHNASLLCPSGSTDISFYCGKGRSVSAHYSAYFNSKHMSLLIGIGTVIIGVQRLQAGIYNRLKCPFALLVASSQDNRPIFWVRDIYILLLGQQSCLLGSTIA